MLRSLSLVVSSIALSLLASAQSDIEFDAPDAATDALVEQCLNTEGVSMLEGTDVICYNAAIFPEQFLKLNALPAASKIIITSPGGNVATARGMSTILDRRGEPAVIAGQCMSACAMVILPGLDDVHIHRSAHIAVHGITMMPYRKWYGWLKDDKAPTTASLMAAQLGYDFGFIMHSSGKAHMIDHLEGQNVDPDYIQSISDRMQIDADRHSCRVDAKDYWGILDAKHITNFLGERVTRMEAFAQSWGDPNNQLYKDVTQPIGEQTYIFQDKYEDAICP